MKISVIIPCYNCCETIKETLTSLMNNDFELFEVILIDDGSTDNSKGIIDCFISDSRMNIRYYYQTNKGVSMARNLGLHVAEGDYVVFLDADDALTAGFLNAVVFLSNRFDFDTLACYRTKKISDLETIDFDHLVENTKQVSPEKLLEEYTYSKDRLGFTTFVYKKKILDLFSVRFNSKIKYGEDIEFLSMYLAHCTTAVEFCTICYYYRVRRDSATQTVCREMLDLYKSSQRVAKYLNDMHHPFAERFENYMPNRALFAIAHRFAKGRKMEWYSELVKKYPVKEAMRFIRLDYASDGKSRLAAYAFLLSPYLFYFIAII